MTGLLWGFHVLTPDVDMDITTITGVVDGRVELEMTESVLGAFGVSLSTFNAQVAAGDVSLMVTGDGTGDDIGLANGPFVFQMYLGLTDVLPSDVLITVAPPLRVYPRDDALTGGARRTYPPSKTQQRGIRRGPGSYL